MILAKLKFEKKEILFGKELTFNAIIEEIETKKNGRYRKIYSEYQPDYELLYPYRYNTKINLNECFNILNDLDYKLIETII